MNRNIKLPTMAVLITIFFWGISGSVTKIALEELPPSTLALLRFFIAGVLLLVISKILYKNISLPMIEHKKLLLCGLVGYTVYFLFEIYGFKYLTAANGTIILAAIPLFTVLIEIIWLRISISLNKGLGIIVSMLGVVLVIGNSITVSGNPQEILGSFLMIGAAISWAIYSIISKGLDDKNPTLLLTAYQMLYGVLFLLPVSLFEAGQWVILSSKTIISLVYLAILCSAVGCFLYLYAIKGLGASNTNVYINLMPFVGVVAAYFILGESLNPLQYLGGVVIVLGVYLVNKKQRVLNVRPISKEI